MLKSTRLSKKPSKILKNFCIENLAFHFYLKCYAYLNLQLSDVKVTF